MTKIWIDLATPKETLFFSKLIEEFKRRNYELLLTTRKYPETNNLIKYLGLEAIVVGAHGSTRDEKLRCAINRLDKLYKLVQTEKPDGLITFTNPESCRIAYGLGVPVFNFTDMPESDKVMRLTLPLSTAVFSPFFVPKELLWKYWDGPIQYYQCIDPVAWMPAIPKPLKEILPNLEVKRPFIIYRSGEIRASYYNGKDDLTQPIVDHLKSHFPDGTFYEVPRYTTHEMIDMQSLLAHADLFIGGGATMNIEAAWWGTWTLACRPVIASYDRWMEENLLQYRAYNIEGGVDIAIELLAHKSKNTRAGILWKQVFPLKNICDIIEESLNSSSASS
jgi:hypothetical protein